ncbi:MAG: HAMP domain-containing histidine kinase, partial [Treponema sp.]|nr:HAMP domain-containing histidine kinase [Treponema sp.]
MKIKTQFYLLILGIIALPLMVLIIQHLLIEMRQKTPDSIATLPSFERPFDERCGNKENGRPFNERRENEEKDWPGPSLQKSPESWQLERPQPPEASRGELRAEGPEGPGPRQPGQRPLRLRFHPLVFIIVLVVIIALFAALMSFFIARSITKSVMVLEDATRRIAAGDLDLAVDVRGSNEITSLTASLNRMRDALKEDGRRRARFIMGVTHDLKTPLSIIQSYAELIDDGMASDPASQKTATEIILAKVDQLETMINHLIEFVKMDTGEWQSQLSNVNIADFLKTFARRFILDVEALHHKMTANITIPENTFVLLDENLVMRALENLVGNAIRHTPDGSLITFDASQDENSIHIIISDNG